ncbi:hypothetical protein PVAG01_05576 [Phlyctema vagabunda]|uniref:Uncharacterized protein n=1 Tax=Phlyctema vagabunda TaxID=108571 RepID=A0ABR4PKF5_9HELO
MPPIDYSKWDNLDTDSEGENVAKPSQNPKASKPTLTKSEPSVKELNLEPLGSGTVTGAKEYTNPTLDDSLWKNKDENGDWVVTPYQARQLTHWKYFGQRSDGSEKRIVASDWSKKEPFKEPQITEWPVPLPADRITKLLNGYRPGGQEGKWFVYADGPDFEGHAVLHMLRSWTGYAMIDLAIKINIDEESGEEESADIVTMTWDLASISNEEFAKYMALEVCRWVLGVKVVEHFDEPKEWDDLPLVYPAVKDGQTVYKKLSFK